MTTIDGPATAEGARTGEATPACLQARPQALLLDFGGVVFRTRKRDEGIAEMAEIIARLLARAGHQHEPASLIPVLQGGKKALSDWKNSQSRRLEPVELDHRTIWRDYYGAPLPAAAREVLVGHARELQAEMTTRLAEHRVRPGIPELLATAAELGIPVGIVSNAHSGRAHRLILARAGLDGRFGVQVYSDEVGIRKPHPGIIELAAQALDTDVSRCWYVGDTLDRDVVAGRRAGVAAIVLTRHHHTDRPPFPVTERADLVLDDPRGLAPLLARSRPGGGPAATAVNQRAHAATTSSPSALLLDHGGVISTSVSDPALLRRFPDHLAARLTAAGLRTTPEEAARALDEGRRRHKAWKAAHEATDGPVLEVDPATFWLEFVGAGLPGHGRALSAWLRAEAHDLMFAYARAKSARRLRPGVRDLMARAHADRVPIGIVSNTVCGRAVRSELERHGLLELVAAHVYSDELGRRKPDPAGVLSALAALDADPSRAWFIGDKPHRDVPAARGAGVGTVVLVRGGSTSDAAIAAAPPEHRPDHVVDQIADLSDRLFPAIVAPPE